MSRPVQDIKQDVCDTRAQLERFEAELAAYAAGDSQYGYVVIHGESSGQATYYYATLAEAAQESNWTGALRAVSRLTDKDYTHACDIQEA